MRAKQAQQHFSPGEAGTFFLFAPVPCTLLPWRSNDLHAHHSLNAELQHPSSYSVFCPRPEMFMCLFSNEFFNINLSSPRLHSTDFLVNVQGAPAVRRQRRSRGEVERRAGKGDVKKHLPPTSESSRVYQMENLSMSKQHSGWHENGPACPRAHVRTHTLPGEHSLCSELTFQAS